MPSVKVFWEYGIPILVGKDSCTLLFTAGLYDSTANCWISSNKHGPSLLTLIQKVSAEKTKSYYFAHILKFLFYRHFGWRLSRSHSVHQPMTRLKWLQLAAGCRNRWRWQLEHVLRSTILRDIWDSCCWPAGSGVAFPWKLWRMPKVFWSCCPLQAVLNKINLNKLFSGNHYLLHQLTSVTRPLPLIKILLAPCPMGWDGNPGLKLH